MSQWKIYDILMQCVVHLSTCVYCSFQDWFQFPLRISIMSTALERWNLNASEFFVLVFAVFVFCFNSCNLWSSCLPNWQGGGCSTSSCEHVGNSRISSILAESWPKPASRQHRKDSKTGGSFGSNSKLGQQWLKRRNQLKGDCCCFCRHAAA